MPAHRGAREPEDTSLAEEREVNPNCSALWQPVADTQALSALADIIFAAVSSVYVNDRPSEIVRS